MLWSLWGGAGKGQKVGKRVKGISISCLFCNFLPCLLFSLASSFLPWSEMKGLLDLSAASPDKEIERKSATEIRPTLFNHLQVMTYPATKTQISSWAIGPCKQIWCSPWKYVMGLFISHNRVNIYFCLFKHKASASNRQVSTFKTIWTVPLKHKSY